MNKHLRSATLATFASLALASASAQQPAPQPTPAPGRGPMPGMPMMADCPQAGMGQGMWPGMGQGMGPGMGQGIGMGLGPGMGQGMGPGMGMGSGMDMSDHIEGRIAYLHAELKISSGQEKAWSAVAAAMRDNARAMQAQHASMMAAMGSAKGDGMDLMQRMQVHEQWLAARLAGTRALHAAMAKLYEGFTPEQKAQADDLFAMQMGMGSPRR